MSSISRVNTTNIAEQISTKPTPAEKKIADAVVKEVKEAGEKIKDTVKGVAKTPEGKAIVGGLMVTPLLPIIGPTIVLGGIGAAALKFFAKKGHESAHKIGEAVKNHDVKEVAKDVAKAGVIVGGALAAGPLGVVAGIAAGKVIDKAAEQIDKNHK